MVQLRTDSVPPLLVRILHRVVVVVAARGYVLQHPWDDWHPRCRQILESPESEMREIGCPGIIEKKHHVLLRIVFRQEGFPGNQVTPCMYTFLVSAKFLVPLFLFFSR